MEYCQYLKWVMIHQIQLSLYLRFSCFCVHSNHLLWNFHRTFRLNATLLSGKENNFSSRILTCAPKWHLRAFLYFCILLFWNVANCCKIVVKVTTNFCSEKKRDCGRIFAEVWNGIPNAEAKIFIAWFEVETIITILLLF